MPKRYVFWEIFGLLPLGAAVAWIGIGFPKAYLAPSAEMPGPGVSLAALASGAAFFVVVRVAVNVARHRADGLEGPP